MIYLILYISLFGFEILWIYCAHDVCDTVEMPFICLLETGSTGTRPILNIAA